MIALIGARGSGKTTAGRLAATQLGRPFIDLDETLEAESGRTIAEWIAADEPGFREAEARCLEAVTSAGPADAVVATGGGAVLHPDAPRRLRRAVVLYLRAVPETLRERLRGDPRPRPALLGCDALQEVAVVLAARDPIYRSLADAIVETEGLTLDAAARALAGVIARCGALEAERAKLGL